MSEPLTQKEIDIREAAKAAYFTAEEKKTLEKQEAEYQKIVPPFSPAYPNSSFSYNVMTVAKLRQAHFEVVDNIISYAGERWVRHGHQDVAILVTEPGGKLRAVRISDYFEFGKFLVERENANREQQTITVVNEQTTVSLLTEILEELRKSKR